MSIEQVTKPATKPKHLRDSPSDLSKTMMTASNLVQPIPATDSRLLKFTAIAGGFVVIACVVTTWWLVHPTRSTDSEPVIAATSPKSDSTASPTDVATGQNGSLIAFPRDPGSVTDDTADQSDKRVFVRSAPSIELLAATAGKSSTVPASGLPRNAPSSPQDAAPGAFIPPKSDATINESADTPNPPQDQPPPADAPEDDVPRGRDPTYVPTQLADRDKLAKFENEIRDLLELGWGSKQSALDAAQAHFQTAIELCPDDPRAAYALGIVLLKNNKYDEAITQFDGASEHATCAYLPAYRAAIWLRVLKKYYEPATLSLVKFTRTWRQQSRDPLPAWIQSDIVNWTGRMIGFLDGPVETRSVDALVDKCIAEISASLTPDQRELFASARNDVLDDYAGKATAQEKARMEAKRQQERTSEETKTRLAQETREAKQEKKQIEKNADDLEKSLNDQLAGIDFQINILLRDQDRFDLQMRRLSNALQFNQQEIANLIAQRNQILSDDRGNPPTDSSKTGTSKTPPKTPTNNTPTLFVIGTMIDQKNRERLLYQADYDRAERQLHEIQRQGIQLANKRQALINDYQTTTGKLYKERESIVSKEKLLEIKKREASRPATGSTGQVKAMGQTARALRTYVDLNLELEKQHVLDSFETP